MFDFHLVNLDIPHLEKVIRKLDNKSYCRLQLTCRELGEFIQANRNISIHIDGMFEIKVWSGEVVCYRLFPEVRVHGLYGSRLALLSPDLMEFDQLREYLEKYRITCEELRINHPTWTKEECQNLLHLVKPLAVTFKCSETDGLEILFKAKSLENVKVEIFLDEEVLTLAPRLMSKFLEVRIDCPTAQHPLLLLQTIMKILKIREFPNLQKFHILLPGTSADELKTTLDDLKLLVKKTWEDRPNEWLNARCTTSLVDMPAGFTCKIVQCTTTLLYYEKGDLDSSSSAPVFSSPIVRATQKRRRRKKKPKIKNRQKPFDAGDPRAFRRDSSDFSFDDDDLGDLDTAGAGPFQQLYIGRRF